MNASQAWIVFLFGLMWSRTTRMLFDISIYSLEWWIITVLFGVLVVIVSEAIWSKRNVTKIR